MSIYFHEIKLHSLKYPPNILALFWHSTPAYYGFQYYAGIFDAGLDSLIILSNMPFNTSSIAFIIIILIIVQQSIQYTNYNAQVCYIIYVAI